MSMMRFLTRNTSPEAMIVAAGIMLATIGVVGFIVHDYDSGTNLVSRAHVTDKIYTPSHTTTHYSPRTKSVFTGMDINGMPQFITLDDGYDEYTVTTPESFELFIDFPRGIPHDGLQSVSKTLFMELHVNDEVIVSGRVGGMTHCLYQVSISPLRAEE